MFVEQNLRPLQCIESSVSFFFVPFTFQLWRHGQLPGLPGPRAASVVRHTNTKEKRMEGGHKKHDIKYFCCLGSNDGDGKMEFQGLSDSCEVVQSTRTKRRD
ncbi:hypothetical protein AVEN_130828-1 [Araneus ventricosus]|uniref:Uncharacterized protein n=1 Tax=Araneus ventricosus TaxID=182803 RepID=A0A4Y2G4Q2_ARAVE|nr:hypothetical protein AVEN_19837-1 [Araneus ventricosus]GBM48796.1 hypothetical protein AVEN_70954-1 [Araneus ventricosus]GBM48803.1 hypothetical protein AVEN_77613-1 [Araneus ventricosus]GBM48832.1 hypothetical protein AVEN_130828-1 [Araneus ventricosus]